jgi:hypothetical protein
LALNKKQRKADIWMKERQHFMDERKKKKLQQEEEEEKFRFRFD